MESTALAHASAKLLQMLTGKWISQAIATAAKLGIADHVDDEPRPSSDLATAIDADVAATYRLLRALASVGVFREHEGQRFSHTPLSQALRSDSPSAMRDMAIFMGDRPTWDAWGELSHSIRTGKSAFEHVHGKLPFAFLTEDEPMTAHFNRAMIAFTMQEIQAVLEVCDLSRIGCFCDVGGGEGALLATILGRHPEARGILFERPEVVGRARAHLERAQVADRCEIVAGSFFESVPPGADAYLMKHILHDWSDTDATRILQTVRAAASPETRLVILDNLVDAASGPDFCKLLDLEMLVLYEGGRERTAAECETLLAGAGFRMVSVTATKSLLNVIEARCV